MAFEQFDAAVRSQIHEVLSGLPETKSGVQFVYPVDTGALELVMPGHFGEPDRIITSTSWSDMANIAPEVTKILSTAKGKVVFIGNGLSPIPLIFADQFTHGDLRIRPMINDQFDYLLLLDDLTMASDSLRDQKLPVTSRFTIYQSAANKIVTALENEQLEMMKYMFVHGQKPPQLLANADHVFNIWGPSANRTLDEQLKLLAPGGILAIVPGYTGGAPRPPYTPQYHYNADGRVVSTSFLSLQVA